MHINFEWANSRRILRIQDGQFALAHLGELCATLNQRAWRGRTSRGWTEYHPISKELALRILNLQAVKDAIRSNAAWAVWEQAVQEIGIGRIATAIYKAVA